MIILSDHAPVELNIDLQVEKYNRGRWKLNPSLLRDEQFVAVLKDDINFFWDVNIGTTERLATVWDTLKAFIRGKCLGYSSKKAKESKQKIQTLVKQISHLEK